MGANSRKVAFGGVFAALATVFMCLGGLIPIATYACPALCCVVGAVVLRSCGRRIFWPWFCAVAILSLLLSADKEAALIFLAIGYYPGLKGKLDTLRLGVVLKLLLFNAAVGLIYVVMIYLLGMEQIVAENAELGRYGLLIMAVLGNVTFFLLDALLGRFIKTK